MEECQVATELPAEEDTTENSNKHRTKITICWDAKQAPGKGKMMAQPKHKSARCYKYGPPERTTEEFKELERQFVLDCVAVSTLSDDSGRANPKMATAIPPYNAQKDKHANEYFQKRGTRNLLKKTDQKPPGDSILGKQMDKFFDIGLMGTYLSYRNSAGAGHSMSQVGGHGLFMEKLPPINGYHGPFGFRRNTPWLRKQPSVFIGKIDSRSLVP